MPSSYVNPIDYGTLFEALVVTLRPKTILEIGILDGFSLARFAEASNSETEIRAYDIFEEFNGNHATKATLEEMFRDYPNVSISYGDFYQLHKEIGSMDIIHIDIANNGDVFEYALEHYLPKLSANGIMILEGGSKERDEVDWMVQYDKPKIAPIVEKHGLRVLGTFPSITLATRAG